METRRLGLARRPGGLQGCVTAVSAKVGVLAATLLLSTGAAAASDAGIQIPEGPGSNLVYAKCQTCHDLQYMVDAKGLLPAQWKAVLASMQDYGMEVSDQEKGNILKYLTAYSGPPAGRRRRTDSQGRRQHHLSSELRDVPRPRRQGPARLFSAAGRQSRSVQGSALSGAGRAQRHERTEYY